MPEGTATRILEPCRIEILMRFARLDFSNNTEPTSEISKILVLLFSFEVIF
jgi:hypothetical protein